MLELGTDERWKEQKAKNGVERRGGAQGEEDAADPAAGRGLAHGGNVSPGGGRGNAGSATAFPLHGAAGGRMGVW